jgi:hypothetical protein
MSETYQKAYDREKCRLDEEQNVITSLEQISGWDIIRLERWKPGIVRYHATKGQEHIMGYAEDVVFKRLQLP